METIILASASPRRKELLEQIGVPFRVIAGAADETIDRTWAPEQAVEGLAVRKALDVARQVRSGWVLGADTIVVLKNEILGKPKNGQEAFEMLAKLSNREHEVITGVALVHAATEVIDVVHEKTQVLFAPLLPQEIKAYIKTGEPFDKAGAYAIQGKAAVFIRKIEGCYSNVVGLPLRKTVLMLENAGIYKEVYWQNEN